MTDQARRGTLIALEGPDGVGKTSVAKMLVKEIPNSVYLREPGSTELGERLRHLMFEYGNKIPRTAMTLLFFASRATLMEQEIKPALNSGTNVILDRSFLSTWVYQYWAKELTQPCPYDEWQAVLQLTRAVWTQPLDLLFILYAPYTVCKSRNSIGADVDPYNDAYNLSINDKYQALANPKHSMYNDGNSFALRKLLAADFANEIHCVETTDDLTQIFARVFHQCKLSYPTLIST